MTASLSQTPIAATETTTAPTLVATITAGTTTGHGIVVIIEEQNTTDVATSVTDSAGNTYAQKTLTGTAFVTNGGFSVWETTNANPTGIAASGTVTAHFSSAIAATLFVFELTAANNSNLIAASSVLVQATGASITSNSVTPSGTQLAIGCCGYFHAGGTRTNTTAATIGGAVPSTSTPSATTYSNTVDGAAHNTGTEANALAISAASALTATLSNASTIDGAVLLTINNASAATVVQRPRTAAVQGLAPGQRVITRKTTPAPGPQLRKVTAVLQRWVLFTGQRILLRLPGPALNAGAKVAPRVPRQPATTAPGQRILLRLPGPALNAGAKTRPYVPHQPATAAPGHRVALVPTTPLAATGARQRPLVRLQPWVMAPGRRSGTARATAAPATPVNRNVVKGQPWVMAPGRRILLVPLTPHGAAPPPPPPLLSVGRVFPPHVAAPAQALRVGDRGAQLD